MRYSWDQGKERRNLAKHGLDFTFAEHVFADPHLAVVFDRIEDGEERWHAVGVWANTVFWLWSILTRIPRMTKPFASLECARLRGLKELAMRKNPEHRLTEAQLAQLKALEGRQPDTADIPEAPAENWKTARRGPFFRPRKEAISLRVDMDVLDWLRRRGPGYQTEINRILREKMEAESRS